MARCASGCLLVAAACGIPRARGVSRPQGPPEYLAPLPALADSSRSWEFVRRPPSVDSIEQPFAELHERDELLGPGSQRVRLIATSLPPFEATDTLIVDGATFAPIEETAAATSYRFHYVYSGSRVTGTLQRRGSPGRSVDATFDTPVFVFNELERIVRGLTYRAGLTVVVPLFSESDADLEHDTLTVLGDTLAQGERAWIVRFADPVIVTRYVVDARDRTLIEADTRQRRSGILIRQIPKTRAPRLDTPKFDSVARHFRMVPRGRAQRDTTAWSVTRTIQGSGSSSMDLQVMIATRGGVTTTDSILFDPRTLVPVWEHVRGADVRLVTFGPSQVVTRVSNGGGPGRTINTPTRGFVYSSVMDDLVVQSLPFANGYRAVLPFWGGEALEMDTVTVRTEADASAQSHASAAWVVDLAEPYTIETLWIDRSSRWITRHLYRVRQTGAIAEVVSTDSLR